MKSICPKDLGGSAQNRHIGHTHFASQKRKEIYVRQPSSHSVFPLFWEGRCLVAGMCGFCPQAVLAATLGLSLAGRHRRVTEGACRSLAKSLISMCCGSQVGPGDFLS